MAAIDWSAEASAQIAEIWALLEDAARNKSSPLNLPSVATVTVDGGPAVRTVVLREADRNGPFLTFYTDIRSHKVVQLTAHPRLAWHFWHPGLRLQLRADAHAVLHHKNAVAQRAWQGLHEGSRALYREPLPPGTHIADVTEALPDADTDGFANFSVVATCVSQVEVLELLAVRHRRARFICDSKGVARQDLVP